MDDQITIEQLVRLYKARNEANSKMSQALRNKDKSLIAATKAEASRLNHAYDDARKAYKRQQKTSRKVKWRTTLIRFYMDYHEIAKVQ